LIHGANSGSTDSFGSLSPDAICALSVCVYGVTGGESPSDRESELQDTVKLVGLGVGDQEREIGSSNFVDDGVSKRNRLIWRDTGSNSRPIDVGSGRRAGGTVPAIVEIRESEGGGGGGDVRCDELRAGDNDRI